MAVASSILHRKTHLMQTLDAYGRNQAVFRIQRCTGYYINLYVSTVTGFNIEKVTEYKKLESFQKNLHLNVLETWNKSLACRNLAIEGKVLLKLFSSLPRPPSW